MGPTLEALREPFEAEHPGARLRTELSSSRQACAKVSDQGRVADLVVSADEGVLRELLLGRHTRELVRFAGNRLVVAAVKGSAVGRRLASEPWQRVVADPKVRVGIADPAQAPVGARALEALRLNDAQVQDPALRVGAGVTARLTGRFVRPDVSKLIAPLETGELDAAFVYESEARQYGFAFILLDPSIDGSTTTFYALAVPREAPHPELAAALITLLLSDRGRAIAGEHYLSLLTPPVTIEAP